MNRARAIGLMLLILLCITSVAVKGSADVPAKVGGEFSSNCSEVWLWKLPEVYPPEPGSDLYHLTKQRWEAHQTKAKIVNILMAAAYYCHVNGQFPISLAELDRFSDTIREVVLCNLFPESYADAWGHPMYYAIQDDRPLVVSAGPDERFTTSDDISSPEASNPSAYKMDIETSCSLKRR